MYVTYILIYTGCCYNLKQFKLRLIMVQVVQMHKREFLRLITQVLTSSDNGNINLVLQEGNQHTSLNYLTGMIIIQYFSDKYSTVLAWSTESFLVLCNSFVKLSILFQCLQQEYAAQ